MQQLKFWYELALLSRPNELTSHAADAGYYALNVYSARIRMSDGGGVIRGMANGYVEDGIKEVRLPRVILKEFSAFRPTTHVVKQDAGREELTAAAFAFDLLNGFPFEGGKGKLVSEPFLSFGNMPKP